MIRHTRGPAAGGRAYGSPFADNLTEVDHLQKVSIRYGSWIDGIQPHWEADGKPVSGSIHGNGGGPSEGSFTLNHDEYINKIDVGSGAISGATVVCSLKFYTNRGETHGPYPPGGPAIHKVRDEVLESPTGVSGFFGTSGGTGLNSLGCFTPSHGDAQK